MNCTSTMVSARIPNDKYEQGIRKLKKLDSNVSDLVKAAFDYVIKAEQLPVQTQSNLKPGKRHLKGKKLAEFNLLFGANDAPLTLPENFDYKDALASEIAADYEAIS